ncbi:MAG: hypothetical protein QW255_05425 [Candidatus Bilamarchaeaceae archaeon]
MVRVLLKYCISFLLYFWHNQLLSQDIVHIIAKKGTVYYSVDNQSWRKINTGDRLNSNGYLKIDTLSYLAIVVNQKQGFELKKPGIYAISNFLQDKNITGEKTNESLRYVISMATSRSGVNPSGLTLGAISRDINETKIYTPKKTVFFSDSVVFSWKECNNCSGYQILILNEDGEVVYKHVITNKKDTTVKLDLTEFTESAKKYYFKINTIGGNINYSKTAQSFVILNSKEFGMIKSERDYVLQDVDTSSALGCFLVGMFYESYNMYAYALHYYNKAIDISGGVSEYIDRKNAMLYKITKIE